MSIIGGLVALIFLCSCVYAVVNFGRMMLKKPKGGRDFAISMIVGFVCILIMGGSSGSSSSGASATTASATDAPAATEAPAHESPMTGDDGTIGSTDHKDLACFADTSTYQKFIDATVNHDQEAAAAIWADVTFVPSGSAVHVIGINIWKSYYDVRITSTAQECIIGQTDEVVFRDLVHHND